MILTGVIVNAAAIAICALIGTFLIKDVPKRFNEIITKGLGLAIVYIGISGALESENMILLIISMIIGSLFGEWIDLDRRMNWLGEYTEKRLGASAKQGTFAKGFVTASILFCTGSMAIVGAINSGLMGDFNTFYAKSILDGTITIVFASTMGIGVLFSAFAVLIYEGTLTLGAAFFKEFLTTDIIREMSAVGSLIIMGIGFNFLEIKNLKVANMIPAMFIPIIYYWVVGYF